MCALCECCGCLDSYSRALCEAGSVQRQRKGDRNSPPLTTHSHSYRADANFHVIKTPHIQCNRKTQLRLTDSLCFTSVYSQRMVKKKMPELWRDSSSQKHENINILICNAFDPSRLFWWVAVSKISAVETSAFSQIGWNSGCDAQSANRYISTSQQGAKLFFPH